MNSRFSKRVAPILALIVVLLLVGTVGTAVQANTEATPCIELFKEAPDQASRGETITILFNVHNCGNVPLEDVKVVDAVMPDWWTHEGALLPGEWWNFSADYTIPEDWPYPKICAIAIATGWYEGEKVSDWDCECIELVEVQEPTPCVSVLKCAVGDSGDTEMDEIFEVREGQVFYWYVKITNCGETELDVWVNDTSLGLSLSENLFLDIGAEAEFWLEYTASEGDMNGEYMICNQVMVEAYYGEQVLEASAEACVMLVIPMLTVEKTAMKMVNEEPVEVDLVEAGDEMFWSVVVCNIGNVALEGVWVNDSLVEYYAQHSIEPGECLIIDLPYTVDASDAEGGIIFNEVLVSYQYDGEWTQIDASDSVELLIEAPTYGIEVAKSTDVDYAGPGDIVVWNITVFNTGDSDLFGVWVNDSMLGLSLQIDLPAGEVAFIESPELIYILDPEDIDDSGKVCNTVEVEVWVETGPLRANDTACVLVTAEIFGYKFFDGNKDGEWCCCEPPIADWEINLYGFDGQGDLMFSASTLTDDDGRYSFTGLDPGLDYVVEEEMPEGWYSVMPASVEVDLDAGDSVNVTFGNYACNPAGLSKGFWKSNIKKWLVKDGKGTQVDLEDIEQYLWSINETYGQDFDFLNFTNTTDDAHLWKAYEILDIPDSSNMTMKAQAQILALLLTAEHIEGYEESGVQIPDMGWGYCYTGSMDGAIAEILDLYSDGEYELAKDLADYLNNQEGT